MNVYKVSKLLLHKDIVNCEYYVRVLLSEHCDSKVEQIDGLTTKVTMYEFAESKEAAELQADKNLTSICTMCSSLFPLTQH